MEAIIREKLESIVRECDELLNQMTAAQLSGNTKELAQLGKAYASLSEIRDKYNLYLSHEREIERTSALLKENDPDLAELAREEIEKLRDRMKELEQELKEMLVPKDPNDERNTIMEIRAGTGGEEAALFAADLFRMYGKYAEKKGWKVDVIEAHPSDLNGFKEIIFSIEGDHVYSKLKYEQGVHRVQRVPITEASGRIHTSTVTVAVLPEAEEIEVEIRPEDLRIDICRASGPGGQGVNTTDSAVRITHLPTGISVECQDERSQHKNKAKALKVLRARLLERMRAEQQALIEETRRKQIGTGERSEKIRTYNFPQNRVTDHRVDVSWYKLDEILEGDLDEIISTLIAFAKSEQLEKAIYSPEKVGFKVSVTDIKK